MQKKILFQNIMMVTNIAGFVFLASTKYLCVRTQWCKQDKMSLIKSVWHFPVISKLIQILLYNTIMLTLSHSVAYILGGPIASFIPQEYNKYNNVRKYVFLVQHHMYSLVVNYILWSISLPELLCSDNVSTDYVSCNNVTICPREIGCHTNALQYIPWKMPLILPLPTVKYIILHWYFSNNMIKLTKITEVFFLKVFLLKDLWLWHQIFQNDRVKSPTHSCLSESQGRGWG